MANNGDSGDTAQPLLTDQNEVEAAWDEDVENSAAERIPDRCTVQDILQRHPHDVLKFLQTAGIEKLAEFSAEDDLIFGAFGDNPILTFGSDRRHLDAEAEWRAQLSAERPRRQASMLGSRMPAPGWSNKVAVEAFVTTVKHAAGPGGGGLIQPLIRQWQAKRCSFAVFSLPAVQSVIRFKWTRFARRILIAELVLYCLWVVSFYTFTAAMQDEDLSLPLAVLVTNPRGRITVAAEIAALIFMSPFLLLEAGTIAAYGWRWIRDPTNMFDLLTYSFQIAISALHLGRVGLSSRWLTYCLSLQCIFLTFRLQYFTQVLRPMRFSFTNIVHEVLAEVRWVLLFVGITCIGFGAALHITFRKEEEPPEEFSSFLRAILASFEHLYGDLQLKDFFSTKDPIFATALAIAFIIVMGYVLVNLLIGVIINSLDRVLEHEGAKQLCNQARVIDEIESLLPTWYERWHPDWHPAYVHVLRINPDKLDSIELDKLWSRHGEFAPVMLRRSDKRDDEKKNGGGDEDLGKDSMHEIMAKLELLENQVQKSLEMQHELLHQNEKSLME